MALVLALALLLVPFTGAGSWASGSPVAPRGTPVLVAEGGCLTDDGYGSALAVSGGLAAVGDHCAGEVTVLEVGSRTTLCVLRDPDGGGSGFGRALAWVGDQLAVGAHGADLEGRADAGAVHLYALGAQVAEGQPCTAAPPPRTLHAPDASAGDWFGFSLTATPHRLFATALFEDGAVPDQGAVHVYDAPTWTLAGTIANPYPGSRDQFGEALANDGVHLVVSAGLDTWVQKDGKDTTLPRKGGAAFLFDLATFAHTATFVAPSPEDGGQFGFAVAIEGDRVAVSEEDSDDAGSRDHGAVHLYDLKGRHLHTYASPGAIPHAAFGWSIALHQGRLISGAAYNSEPVTYGGSVDVFSTHDHTVLATYTSPEPVYRGVFGRTVAPIGGGILISAPGEGRVYGVDVGAPVAVIAPIADVECRAGHGTVVLDGSTSYDPEGHPLTYGWTAHADGQGDLSIASPTAARTFSTLPIGSTVVQLRVSDGTLSGLARDEARVVDTQPPTTTEAVEGGRGDGAWWVTPVAIDISGDDACGIDAIHHRLDDGPLADGSSLTLNTDGRHLLTHHATDLGGNQGAPRSRDVWIDQTEPTVTLADPVEGRAYLHDEDLGLEDLPRTVVLGTKTLRAGAFDATSGIREVTFLVDGATVGVAIAPPYEVTWHADSLAPGEYSVTAIARDHAGNTATTAPLVVTVAPTDPRPSGDGALELPGPDGQVRLDRNIRL